jgi:hypothetical protein
MALMPKFQQFSPGVVQAQLEAQKKVASEQEDTAATMGAMTDAATPKTGTATPAPILNSSQNDGKRGVLSASGTPTGQTATASGAVAQASQNSNAQNGI